MGADQPPNRGSVPAVSSRTVKVTPSDVSREEDYDARAERRFAQNIVAEAMTIILAIGFGLVSSILIVRGLPRTPVYEFYIYVLVFSWIGVLLPLCVFGVDVALMKHLPELASQRHASIRRVVLWAVLVTLVANGIILGICWIIFLVFSTGGLVAGEVLPYLLLALLTLPLTGLSIVIQGVYRGFQEMRFCTYVMGLYHGLYLGALVILYLLSTFTLLHVILLNIGISLFTLVVEVLILVKLLQRYGDFPLLSPPKTLSRGVIVSTAMQALLLALLGGVFLNLPLLIANVYRTSEVLLAGLGLAVSVAVYLQRGQAAPFRPLMPKVSGDMARGSLPLMEGYVNRAVKLGTLFNGFILVLAATYAAPLLALLFASEGLVAAPFFVLMAGSFVVYPLASIMMDTLVGLGSVREVLIIYTGWTITLCGVLVILCPWGREVVVALSWLTGLPFLLVFLQLYRRRTGMSLDRGFLPKGILVLICVGFLAVLFQCSTTLALSYLGIAGLPALGLQINLIISSFPLFLLYLWMLVKVGVLKHPDLMALASISQVLHPLSLPVTWLIQRLEQHTATAS